MWFANVLSWPILRPDFCPDFCPDLSCLRRSEPATASASSLCRRRRVAACSASGLTREAHVMTCWAVMFLAVSVSLSLSLSLSLPPLLFPLRLLTHPTAPTVFVLSHLCFDLPPVLQLSYKGRLRLLGRLHFSITCRLTIRLSPKTPAPLRPCEASPSPTVTCRVARTHIAAHREGKC